MKIIITESQYEMLSNSLRRRLTPNDFKYFDTNLVYHIDDSTWIPNFNEFSYEVISGLLIEFVYAKKHNELPVPVDVGFDMSNNIPPEVTKVFDLYFEIIPFLEKKYKNRLYQAWKVKGRSR
jgi:hypothetical protein